MLRRSLQEKVPQHSVHVPLDTIATKLQVCEMTCKYLADYFFFFWDREREGSRGVLMSSIFIYSRWFTTTVKNSNQTAPAWLYKTWVRFWVLWFLWSREDLYHEPLSSDRDEKDEVWQLTTSPRPHIFFMFNLVVPMDTDSSDITWDYLSDFTHLPYRATKGFIQFIFLFWTFPL